MTLTRRTFALLASTAIFVSGAQAAETADIIYSGGPILTMDDARPRAEAVAIKDGRILAVGAADDRLGVNHVGPRRDAVFNDRRLVGIGRKQRPVNLAQLLHTIADQLAAIVSDVHVVSIGGGEGVNVAGVVGLELLLHDFFGCHGWVWGLGFRVLATT